MRALQHALQTGRLHHAYLLTGARGVGKTTLARIFAKALNCQEGVVQEPCGRCSSCQEIDSGRFVDYIEIDAASNRGVNDIQQLLEQARFAPTAGRFKVYVIDEVHMLSGHAFNAMLKTLEEPPAEVKFVLATTDPQKIPVTVLSRCLQFSLKNLRRDVLLGHLDFVLGQEAVVSEPEALEALARAARGSARDALSLTDQAIAYGGGSVSLAAVSQMLGLVRRDALLRLAEHVVDQRAAEALAEANDLLDAGASAEAILDDLARLFHELVAAAVLGAMASDEAEPALRALAEKVSAEDAQLAYQIAILGRRDLPLAPDEVTGLQMSLLRLLAFAPQTAHSAPATQPPGPARSVPQSPAVSTPRRPAAPLLRDAPTPATTLSSAIQTQALPLSGLTAESWPGLMKKLPLTGLSRQFAQQSSFLGPDPRASDRLQVSVPIEALAEPSLVARIESALAEQMGQPVRLLVTIGASLSPTAAAQEAAKAAELQRRAEENIRQSPVIQAIIREFDATIVPGSIRWVGPDPEDL